MSNMSFGDAFFLIQNLLLMLIMTWSVLTFCAGKKKKGDGTVVEVKNETEMTATGSTSACGKEADENVKPPVVNVPSGTDLVDGEGFIRNAEDNDELGTLKYLEEFKPPQTLPYNVEEISIIEKAYERLHPELEKKLRYHKTMKYPKHKKYEKEDLRKQEEEERKLKMSKEENDKKDKGKNEKVKHKKVPGSRTKTKTNTMTE